MNLSDEPITGPNPQEVQADFLSLLTSVRTGVLITLNADGPFGSHVPFLLGHDWTRLYIHISQLAQHTKNLAADRRIALFVAESDQPTRNPMALKRINLQGTASPLDAEGTAYADIKLRYLERFPQSAMTFQLPDFRLWVLNMTTAHFVAGFGRAFLAASSAPAQWQHQRG